MSVQQRLTELGLVLPPAPSPAAAYVPVLRDGDHVITAGQIPVVDGALPATGRCGDEIDLDEAQDLARTAALNLLAVCAAEVEDLDRVQLLRLGVFVASADGFTDQHLVANGASLLLHDVLGDRGVHARSAVGVAWLPMNAPVEIEGLFRVV